MLKIILAMCIYCFPILVFSNENMVIEDTGVSLSKNEVLSVIRAWPKDLQEKSKTNKVIRKELLGQVLLNKKMAHALDEILEKDSPDFYWKSKLAVQNLKVQLFLQHKLETLKLPDFVPLAKEYYFVDKERFARMPERRLSSHLLIICDEKACENRKEKKELAEKVLKELNEGADFEALVAKYSEDPISKLKNGLIDKWVSIEEERFSKPYLKALFKINNVKEYSKVVRSRFGYHIIRLDGVHEAYYQDFDKVKENIVASIEKLYKKLYANALQSYYWPSEKAKFNNEMIDKIFSSIEPSKSN